MNYKKLVEAMRTKDRDMQHKMLQECLAEDKYKSKPKSNVLKKLEDELELDIKALEDSK